MNERKKERRKKHIKEINNTSMQGSCFHYIGLLEEEEEKLNQNKNSLHVSGKCWVSLGMLKNKCKKSILTQVEHRVKYQPKI